MKLKMISGQLKFVEYVFPKPAIFLLVSQNSLYSRAKQSGKYSSSGKLSKKKHTLQKEKKNGF